MTQFTIKYDKQLFVFDGISRNAVWTGSDLLSLLGMKVAGNAQLMKNGRFSSMCVTIKKVHLIFLSAQCSIAVFYENFVD